MCDHTGWKSVLLVPKVSNSGEYHRHLAFVSGSNHFFVANRAARLNRAGRASFGSGDEAVRERKKSVACDRAALERKPSFVRFPNRNSPKGACLSVANALSQALRRSGSEPTPQGFVCFRIATVGSSNSAIKFVAALMSRMLLNERSFP